MQMFRKPVKTATQGDRVGICVTQFDPKTLERGLVSSPGYLPTLFGALVEVHKIPYFKGACLNKSKFHITVGYETVMAKLQFFGPSTPSIDDTFNTDREYVFQEELDNTTAVLSGKTATTKQYLLLEFERPITCPKDSLLIGSRLDTDINMNTCRLAFHGHVIVPFLSEDFQKTFYPQLRISKSKSKEGVIERMADDYSVIVRSLFKKETNLQLFSNMKVRLSTGEDGRIEGGFGQSGKIKVRISDGLKEDTKVMLSSLKKGRGKKGEATSSEDTPSEPVKVYLDFKKYIYDANHKMVQD